MAQIIAEKWGEVISPEQAMRWFCWHEIVAGMEKQKDTLHEVAGAMSGKNIPDWEKQFLLMFLEVAENDLVI